MHCRVVPAMIQSAHAVVFEPDVHPPALTMRWWMLSASMENSRCAEGVPDRSSSSRARARSKRTGCRSAIALIGWSGTKTGRPNLTSIPSRTGGRGRFSAGTHVRCAQGCPEPTARGSGAAPHDRTCAPVRRRGVQLTVSVHARRQLRFPPLLPPLSGCAATIGAMAERKETHAGLGVGIRGSMLSPDGATCRGGAVG